MYPVELLADALFLSSRSETKYNLEDGESEEQSQDLAGSSQRLHGNQELTFVFTLVPNQFPRQRGLWVIAGLQP